MIVSGKYRIRITVMEDGTIEIVIEPLPTDPKKHLANSKQLAVV
jgi:hypothetical protein